MDKAQARETRHKSEQARREYWEREKTERAALAAALRAVRDHPDSTPAERLRAVELLLKMTKEWRI